ncbi:MAG: sigma-70 family RNA polymerase sigma factor [Oscillospiraceae bacterium]|nr:sigma-70 family RNA polymerase sigma factor [Oscillospiraceae bacterium]MBR6561513.1 sigma-70 family RNA polymerase sigma factor [Oscillospiraceae bacterium]
MEEKYNKQEEQALFALVAAGNREAEEALAMRYSRLVRACARPYFLAGGDSEDLTQEGMFGLLSAIREYDPGEQVSFQAYAETCIRNRLRSAIRAASRLKHQPLNQGVSLENVMLEDEGSANKSKIAFRRVPEEMVLARESADEFNENIAQRLSEYEHEVLELFLRGLSYQEMAERTGRSVKSVDNAVQRIRRKLARYYDLGEFSES